MARILDDCGAASLFFLGEIRYNFIQAASSISYTGWCTTLYRLVCGSSNAERLVKVEVCDGKYAAVNRLRPRLDCSVVYAVHRESAE